MHKFIRFTGKINITAGFLLLAFWFLYALLLPYKELDTTIAILVQDQQWTFINVLGVMGSVLGLFGLTGIYLKDIEKTKTAGMIGFTLAFIGTMLITVPLIWDTLIWPILATHDPSLLAFDGPIYTSKTFLPYFIGAGSVYSLGYLLLGLRMAKTGVNPYWGSLLIAIGAPLFGLGPMLGKLQVYPRTLGVVMFCAGLIWFGRVMQAAKDTPSVITD